MSKCWEFGTANIIFTWHVCPGDTTVKILRRMQQLVAEAESDPTPKIFPDRTIFRADNEQMCIINAQHVANLSKDFEPGHWRHIGPGFEQSWNYDSKMTDIVAQLGHPVFQAAER